MIRIAVRYLWLASVVWLAGICCAQNPIRMEVFIREDSEISVQAADYAKRLGERRRGLDVVVHDVIKDQTQLARLWKLARKSGREKPVVPAFYCCDRLFFGFENEQKTEPAIENLFTVDVYTRSTCSKCKAAKKFFKQLTVRWPAIRFRIYEITYDVNARQRYQELCQSRGRVPGLPTIHFSGQVIIGYQGDHVTGAEVENLIRRVAVMETVSPKEKPVSKPSNDTTSAIPSPPKLLRAAQLVAFGGTRQPIGTLSTTLPHREMVIRIAQLQNEDATFDDVPPPEGADFDDVPLPDGAEFDDVPLPSEAGGEDFGEVASPPPQTTGERESDIIQVPFLGELRVSELGLPAFTFLVGLIDGFNPCAMWILVFLLSVLVNIKDRKKILLIAGTFVVVSGLAYYAFMAAWLNLFMLIGIARPAQIILGLMAMAIGIINVKDFFAFKKGVSLSIPEKSKPGLYRRVREIVAAKYLPAALASVIVLAVIVNMVELLCTAGLPALYTQILTMQALPAWKNYAYLALYISAYMLDDAVLLAVVVATLSHRKLQEREGRWLKLLSGLVILALGLVMIFRPDWLQLGH